MPRITVRQENICVFLLIFANICYVLAIFSHSWFKLPEVSYGIWWAIFCDHLSCQIIPAFFTDEPAWYHMIQILCLIGWAGMILSLLMMYKHFHIITKYNVRRQQATAIVCIISGFAISLMLLMFYGKLDESSPSAVPKIHWSAILAGVSCILQFLSGLFLIQ